MKKSVDKLIVLGLLSSFVLIVIPNEKWNILMLQAMILGFFALYEVAAYVFLFSAWMGVVLLSALLLFSDITSIRSLRFLKAAVVILLSRLIIGHIYTYRWITNYDHFYYVIPELIFVSLSVYVLMQQPVGKAPKD